jgi:hypothetical protein
VENLVRVADAAACIARCRIAHEHTRKMRRGTTRINEGLQKKTTLFASGTTLPTSGHRLPHPEPITQYITTG